MPPDKPIIAVTMGDPAGSGPEVVAKALKRKELRSRAHLLLFGDLKVFEKAAELVRLNDLSFVGVEHPSEALFDSDRISVIDLGNVDPSNVAYGRPSSMGGRASYEAVVKAIGYAKAGAVDAIVTAPISKESLSMAGFGYPGHTEILADMTGSRDVRMMLIAGSFRVVHVTTHVSLRSALDLITKESVLKTIEIAHQNLVELFGIQNPRVAVSGLNPHAGEDGLFGDEEITQITPAITAAKGKGIDASGPYPPDTVFYRTYHDRQFDVAIAMFHDQGHIAMKMVGLMEGVNMTLGLPFIRTSPDHGTVWGKAGKGTADENATVEAIKLAIDLVGRRSRPPPHPDRHPSRSGNIKVSDKY